MLMFELIFKFSQIYASALISAHFLLLCERSLPFSISAQVLLSCHQCLPPTASASSALLLSSLFSHPPPCYKINMPHAYTPFQNLLSYSPSIHAKILKTSEFIFTVSLCSGSETKLQSSTVTVLSQDTTPLTSQLLTAVDTVQFSLAFSAALFTIHHI